MTDFSGAQRLILHDLFADVHFKVLSDELYEVRKLVSAVNRAVFVTLWNTHEDANTTVVLRLDDALAIETLVKSAAQAVEAYEDRCIDEWQKARAAALAA